eukprot:CAMPEP_0194763962 /NCGR_PEP_ID=MMETSP0323_2-20130528/20800_1 /TAXON_ID=2866 ORGANISM="Crypthecodinium cohnii, Strain Seligo" /NCGR_SAMPLE_ID=MMETSP0323_2 /ASSEMBLY_ACC=CAM_ASM_000346 /LENGTH=54 /DNA_ID=CAMNT_0039690009 /DNA_START=90 /DNA_END=250 /DNA_ORIENTATION=-
MSENMEEKDPASRLCRDCRPQKLVLAGPRSPTRALFVGSTQKGNSAPVTSLLTS